MADLTKFPEGITEIAQYMDYIPATEGDPEKTMNDRVDAFLNFVFHAVAEV